MILLPASPQPSRAPRVAKRIEGRVAASPRWCLTLFLSLLTLGCASVASANESRFFFSGDGVIGLRHGHFDEKLSVRYRDDEGRYDPDALTRIEHFFRSRDDGQAGEVSIRLVELIDFVEDRYRPTRVVLISGYRSPGLNQRLRDAGSRVADSSLHREGLAADLQFSGVDLKRMWLDLRDLKVGGVGYYRQQAFLHLDTGQPRFWEPQTSRVDEHLSAGNARVFARTDFDRYRTVEGAVIRLHNVTALPLSIARQARFGSRTLTLEPLAAGVRLVDGCYVLDRPAPAYRFRIIPNPALAAGSPNHDNIGCTSLPPEEEGRPGGMLAPEPIRLTTCAPRVEATPEEIESNPVELILDGAVGHGRTP